MDKIRIEDLKLRCIIGVNAEERDILQDVIINIELYCDLSRAAHTDEIAHTVDYKKLKQDIRTLVERSSFRLLETLATSVAERCLETSGVKTVNVKVDKPGALRFARNVAVEIERSANSA